MKTTLIKSLSLLILITLVACNKDELSKPTPIEEPKSTTLDSSVWIHSGINPVSNKSYVDTIILIKKNDSIFLYQYLPKIKHIYLSGAILYQQIPTYIQLNGNQLILPYQLQERFPDDSKIYVFGSGTFNNNEFTFNIDHEVILGVNPTWTIKQYLKLGNCQTKSYVFTRYR